MVQFQQYVQPTIQCPQMVQPMVEYQQVQSTYQCQQPQPNIQKQRLQHTPSQILNMSNQFDQHLVRNKNMTSNQDQILAKQVQIPDTTMSKPRKKCGFIARLLRKLPSDFFEEDQNNTLMSSNASSPHKKIDSPMASIPTPLEVSQEPSILSSSNNTPKDEIIQELSIIDCQDNPIHDAHPCHVSEIQDPMPPCTLLPLPVLEDPIRSPSSSCSSIDSLPESITNVQSAFPSCQNIDPLSESSMHIQNPTPCQEDNLEHEETCLKKDQDQDPKTLSSHPIVDQDPIFPDTHDDSPILVHPIQSPIDTPFPEQDQDIPVHPIPNDPLPFHEKNVLSNPIGIPLPEKDQDIISILYDDPIKSQEQSTFKEDSNDLPPCQDQIIPLNPPQDPFVPPSSCLNAPYTLQDRISFDDRIIYPIPSLEEPVIEPCPLQS